MIRLTDILTESIVITSSFITLMKQFENSIKRGWDKDKKKWFSHTSLEGGTNTIAYGHKMQTTDDYSQGITEAKATELLLSDIELAQVKIKTILDIDIDKLPRYVQQALINAMFRGELKSTYDTVDLMKQDKWQEAASEYINHNDYKNGAPGVKKRMQWNYDKFKYYADSLIVPTEIDGPFPNPVKPGEEVTVTVINNLPAPKAEIKLFNINGKLIKKYNWNNITKGILQFNAPSVLEGVYILAVYINNERILKKLSIYDR